MLFQFSDSRKFLLYVQTMIRILNCKYSYVHELILAVELVQLSEETHVLHLSQEENSSQLILLFAYWSRPKHNCHKSKQLTGNCRSHILNYFISCGTHPKAHRHSHMFLFLFALLKKLKSKLPCNQGSWSGFAWWVLFKSSHVCRWSMLYQWEDRLVYLCVRFSNEIWVGEIHLGAICKQMVIKVIKVKKDIQAVAIEMSTEIVEAVFWVRVEERRVHNWGCKGIKRAEEKKNMSVVRDAKEKFWQTG